MAQYRGGARILSKVRNFTKLLVTFFGDLQQQRILKIHPEHWFWRTNFSFFLIFLDVSQKCYKFLHWSRCICGCIYFGILPKLRKKFKDKSILHRLMFFEDFQKISKNWKKNNKNLEKYVISNIFLKFANTTCIPM